MRLTTASHLSLFSLAKPNAGNSLGPTLFYEKKAQKMVVVHGPISGLDSIYVGGNVFGTPARFPALGFARENISSHEYESNAH